MERLILYLYQRKGDPFLVLPLKKIRLLFASAVVLVLLLSYLVTKFLMNRARNDLHQSVIELAAGATEQSKSIAELISAESLKLPADIYVDKLLTESKITYPQFKQWVELNQIKVRPDELDSLILGKLYCGLLFQKPISEITSNGLKLKRPSPNQISMDKAGLQYSIAYSCISKFRANISQNYFCPLRLLQAFCGTIQWTTIIIGVFGMLLLGSLQQFAQIQKQFSIGSTHLMRHFNVDADFWSLVRAESKEISALMELRSRSSYGLIAAELIHATNLANSQYLGLDLETFIKNWMSDARARTDTIIHEWTDFALDAVTNLGFLGTILGIVEAFGAAPRIIEALDISSRVAAFASVGNAMAMAFDTSFVGLVSYLVLKIAKSNLIYKIDNMWQQIENQAIVELNLILKNGK